MEDIIRKVRDGTSNEKIIESTKVSFEYFIKEIFRRKKDLRLLKLENNTHIFNKCKDEVYVYFEVYYAFISKRKLSSLKNKYELIDISHGKVFRTINGEGIKDIISNCEFLLKEYSIRTLENIKKEKPYENIETINIYGNNEEVLGIKSNSRFCLSTINKEEYSQSKLDKICLDILTNLINKNNIIIKKELDSYSAILNKLDKVKD